MPALAAAGLAAGRATGPETGSYAQAAQPVAAGPSAPPTVALGASSGSRRPGAAAVAAAPEVWSSGSPAAAAASGPVEDFTSVEVGGPKQPNRRMSSEKTSVYNGVYQRSGQKRWTAAIQVDGCHHGLGSYVLEEDAARAYDQALAEAMEKDPNR